MSLAPLVFVHVALSRDARLRSALAAAEHRRANRASRRRLRALRSERSRMAAPSTRQATPTAGVAALDAVVANRPR